MANRFAITGFARKGSDEMLFIFDRKGLRRFVLSKATPSDGFEILSVHEGESIRDLKVKVRTEGEVVEITYDPTIQESGGEKQSAQPTEQTATATPSPMPTMAQPTRSEVREAPKPGYTVRRRTPVGTN